jgi:hypothetical protein
MCQNFLPAQDSGIIVRPGLLLATSPCDFSIIIGGSLDFSLS